MPYTVDYRANSHVNVHHQAGYKLVGDAFFDRYLEKGSIGVSVAIC